MRIALQPLASDACQLRNARRQRRVDHRVDWLAEAFVLEAHAQRELAKEIHVGFALAQRLNRLMRNLQVVMAIGQDKIFVLEEGGGRKHDVGKIGGVGEELLVHHGEQIVALQALPDQVLLRTDRCRIASCKPPAL